MKSMEGVKRVRRTGKFRRQRERLEKVSAIANDDDMMEVLDRLFRRRPMSTASIQKARQQLERCEELSKQFKIVERDETVKRSVKCLTHSGNPTTAEVPLVFRVKLPAPPVYRRRHGRYELTTPVPQPDRRCLEQMKEHGEKFDHCEVWWVPNQILAKPIPQPDPILVGVVKVTQGHSVYFELHRWIDEAVENGYWTHEAY